jgi:broad specificity phosphatase PhoE
LLTTFFLVRHGAHSLLGRVLVGRKVDVPLDDVGLRQTRALAERFSHENISVVQSSPRQRAIQTASPIAERLNVPLNIEGAIDEIDCGVWSGRSFEELSREQSWQEWNCSRATAQPPAGESMADVKQRIVAYLDRMKLADPNGRVMLVSHGEVIRVAILHYLGLSADAYSRIEIDPASVSMLVMAQGSVQVQAVNQVVRP